jgi:hypothetical protein
MLTKLLRTKSGKVSFETTLDPLNPAFSRKGEGLYGWCYRSQYELEMAGGSPSPIKFGQYGSFSQGGSLPQDTIDSYCGTTADSIVIRFVHRLTDDEITRCGNAYSIEQTIGSHLGNSYSYGKSTEVYHTTVDIINELVRNHLYPQSSPVAKLSYPPRLRQDEVITKFTDYFLSGGKEALLGAVMRFGKNFVWLCIGKRLATKGDTLIMLTRHPEVFVSLSEDIKNHTYFSDFAFSELKRIREFKPNPNKVNVLCISTQLLNNRKNKDKYQRLLKKSNCVLLGVDEASSGMITTRSQDIIDIIAPKHTVWIDGTPWKVEATGRFREENSYFYDHIDRMRDFHNGIDKRAVQMDWRMVKVLDSIMDDSVWYTDDEGFTLTKLFSYNKETDSFVHEGHVTNFIKCVLGKIPKTSFSPYLQVDLSNTIWLLPPSVDSVKGVKRIIESITDEYEVFAATDGDVDMKDITNFSKHNPNKKTITLTLGSLVRGTTFPKWDGVFVLCDTESAELYFQCAFRVSTESQNKQVGYVFDFDPKRAINMLYRYACEAANRNGITSTQLILEQILDNFNIYGQFDGVQFEKFDIQKMLESIKNNNLDTQSLKVMRDYIDTQSILDINDKDLIAFFTTYTKTKGSGFFADFETNGSFKKGKNKIIKRSGNGGVDLENKRRNDFISKVQSLCSKLPLMTELGFKSVESILDDMDDALFEEATGVKKIVLKKLIKHKIINPIKINLRLA